jgi:hypothetical protein
VTAGGEDRRISPTAWFLALGVIVAALQTARIAASNSLGAPSQFVDDAYYYFRIAQHVVAGDGSTWDGISHTNGYHPLWLIVLLPVFAIVKSRGTALTVVKGLCGALWIATLWQVARVGRAIDARAAVLIGCLPITIYAAFVPRSLPFSGVETALAIPLLLAAIVPLIDGEPTSPRDEWIAGAWLMATVLARLDAVYAVAALAILAAARTTAARRSGRIAALLRVGAPAAAAFAADLTFNQVVFGNPITTSTRAKTLSPPVANHFPLHQYFRDPGSMPIVVGIGTASGLVVIAALLSGRFARGGDAARARLGRAAEVLAALWIAGTVSVIVFDQQSSFPLWPWYYYEAFIVLLLGPGVVIAALAPNLRVPAPRVASVAIAGAAALGLGVAIGVALRIDANGTENFYTQNAKAAMELNHVLPKDAVVAMGDRAGIVGYYLDRPVVQVEGIVNSNEFLDAKQAGHAHAFLRKVRVTYYAKSANRANRLVLEKDGGPDAKKGCGFRFEPYFGGGDKIVFFVCKHDIVYNTPLAHGEELVVWRYTGGFDVFHVPG